MTLEFFDDDNMIQFDCITNFYQYKENHYVFYSDRTEYHRDSGFQKAYSTYGGCYLKFIENDTDPYWVRFANRSYKVSNVKEFLIMINDLEAELTLENLK